MDVLKTRPTYQRAATDAEPEEPEPTFQFSYDLPGQTPARSFTSNLSEEPVPQFQSGFSYELPDYKSMRSFTSKSSTFPIHEYGDEYRLLGDSTLTPTRPRRNNWAIRFEGWRTGASTAALLAIVSMLINLSVAIWLATKNQRNSVVEVYRGPCGTVAQADTWVHLAINIISTLLLGGSNYCMQCVSAPTRSEVDRFHAKGKYLDIGVPSVRNLRAIPWQKIVLWWALGLSSVPLHLMYNSAFFKSLSTNDYNIFAVTDDFVDGASFNDSQYQQYSGNPYTTQDYVNPLEVQQNLSDYIRREPLDCLRDYATAFLSDKRHLVLVLNNATGEPFVPSYAGAYDNESDALVYQDAIHYSGSDTFDWICGQVPNNAEILQYQEGQWVCEKYYKKWFSQMDLWNPYGFRLEHCLYEPVPEQCSYSANIPIIAVVIVSNFIKIVCMYIVATRLKDNPLITVGDAIESFLNVPDETTKDMCLLNRVQVQGKGWNDQVPESEPTPSDAIHVPIGWFPGATRLLDRIKKLHKARKHHVIEADSGPSTAILQPFRWMRAASHRRWIITMSFFTVALVTSFGLFIFSTTAIRGSGVSISSLGLGRVDTATIITGWEISRQYSATKQIMFSVLIANLPQTILSFLYLHLNGLMTSMWVASEFSSYATARKALRVSNATGAQRSTHFLQLPYKIAVPLMIMSGLLHWLLSQSIFLAVVAEYAADGTLASPVAEASCGFSPLAMILTVSLGVVLVVGTLGIGFFRRLCPGVPLAGSCSAAISAACHRPVWDGDASLKTVMWGVTKEGGGGGEVGHCCFTSGAVAPVEEGKMYAGFVRPRRERVDWRGAGPGGDDGKGGL